MNQTCYSAIIEELSKNHLARGLFVVTAPTIGELFLSAAPQSFVKDVFDTQSVFGAVHIAGFSTLALLFGLGFLVYWLWNIGSRPLPAILAFVATVIASLVLLSDYANNRVVMASLFATAWTLFGVGQRWIWTRFSFAMKSQAFLAKNRSLSQGS